MAMQSIGPIECCEGSPLRAVFKIMHDGHGVKFSMRLFPSKWFYEFEHASSLQIAHVEALIDKLSALGAETDPLRADALSHLQCTVALFRTLAGIAEKIRALELGIEVRGLDDAYFAQPTEDRHEYLALSFTLLDVRFGDGSTLVYEHFPFQRGYSINFVGAHGSRRRAAIHTVLLEHITAFSDGVQRILEEAPSISDRVFE